MTQIDEYTESMESGCTCGLGPGYTCSPDCPAYLKAPPTEIVGKVELVAKTVVRTREEIALKASYVSVSITTTDTAPIQLIGQDNSRKRAVFIASADVLLAKREQAGSGMEVGFVLPANVALEIQNQDELFAVPQGADVIVSVLNERWA